MTSSLFWVIFAIKTSRSTILKYYYVIDRNGTRHWFCLSQGFTWHHNWINAQPNSLSFLNWIQIGALYSCQNLCIHSRFFLYTVHMCSLHITFKASVPICVWPQKDGRWQIGPTLRKTPLEWRLAKGQMSPQHLLQARAAARPCYASHQCCRPVATGYCGSNRRRDGPEVSAEENNEGYRAGMTERIITVSALPQR